MSTENDPLMEVKCRISQWIARFTALGEQGKAFLDRQSITGLLPRALKRTDGGDENDLQWWKDKESHMELQFPRIEKEVEELEKKKEKEIDNKK